MDSIDSGFAPMRGYFGYMNGFSSSIKLGSLIIWATIRFSTCLSFKQSVSSNTKHGYNNDICKLTDHLKLRSSLYLI